MGCLHEHNEIHNNIVGLKYIPVSHPTYDAILHSNT